MINATAPAPPGFAFTALTLSCLDRLPLGLHIVGVAVAVPDIPLQLCNTTQLSLPHLPRHRTTHPPTTHTHTHQPWLSSASTRSSQTSAVTLPLLVQLAPSEMICSTGKQPSWVLATHHIPAVSSSSRSTSRPTTPSSPQRSTSPPASTTPTSTPTAASAWTFCETSGALL